MTAALTSEGYLYTTDVKLASKLHTGLLFVSNLNDATTRLAAIDVQRSAKPRTATDRIAIRSHRGFGYGTA
jgi:hypothetical protein